MIQHNSTEIIQYADLLLKKHLLLLPMLKTDVLHHIFVENVFCQILLNKNINLLQHCKSIYYHVWLIEVKLLIHKNKTNLTNSVVSSVTNSGCIFSVSHLKTHIFHSFPTHTHTLVHLSLWVHSLRQCHF